VAVRRIAVVSQFKYDLNAVYARVSQFWDRDSCAGRIPRGDRGAMCSSATKCTRPSVQGPSDGNNLTFGRLHVIDVSDITKPREVAWYEPTDGGVHNVWVVGDTLYLGNYRAARERSISPGS